MESFIIISFWSTLPCVWTRGPEDHPFAKHSKSNARLIYWFKKDNEVTYSCSKCAYPNLRLKRSIYKCHNIESQIRLKRGRPLGSKDKNPWKRSTKNDTTKEFHEEIQDLINPDIPEEISEPETQVNEELSISSTGDGISLDRSKIIVDNVFAYDVTLNIMKGN